MTSWLGTVTTIENGAAGKAMRKVIPSQASGVSTMVMGTTEMTKTHEDEPEEIRTGTARYVDVEKMSAGNEAPSTVA